jgi:hypothetical protein
VVSKIVPPLPTAIPIEDEANATPKSDIVVPLLMSLMVAVASSGGKSSPAMKHKKISAKLLKTGILSRLICGVQNG